MSPLALDLIAGARIRLAWPFADTRLALPLVAMADPWLVSIFVVGLLALWPGRQRLRTVAPIMLGTAVGFLCLKGALLDHVLRASHLDPGAPRRR
jgi:xanthosine utilization system XapX-like protein